MLTSERDLVEGIGDSTDVGLPLILALGTQQGPWCSSEGSPPGVDGDGKNSRQEQPGHGKQHTTVREALKTKIL